MTSVRIQITDELAHALKLEAVEHGLALEDWISRKLGQTGRVDKPRKSAYGLLAKYGPGPCAEEIDENRRDMFRGFADAK